MKYFPLLLLTLLMACDSENKQSIEKEAQIDTIIIQGHRGCRGLFPENSIPGFEKALELGVSTFELDVVLSEDQQLVVSHESWMNPEICFNPNGNPIGEDEGKSLNFYQMPLEEIQSFRFGTKGHPDFPNQEKIACQKPTLAQVVKASRIKAQKLGKALPDFDIEIKSSKSTDGIYHPTPSVYARLFLEEYFKLHLEGKSTVQSFDPRLLQEIHNTYPELPLVLLVDFGIKSPEIQLKKLNFVPFGLSPPFAAVSDSLVLFCKEKEIHLSTWTVDDVADINKLLDMGVRDIISDYPNRVLEIAQERNLVVQH